MSSEDPKEERQRRNIWYKSLLRNLKKEDTLKFFGMIRINHRN